MLQKEEVLNIVSVSFIQPTFVFDPIIYFFFFDLLACLKGLAVDVPVEISHRPFRGIEIDILKEFSIANVMMGKLVMTLMNCTRLS